MNPGAAAGGELITVFDLIERPYPLDILLRVKLLHASTIICRPSGLEDRGQSSETTILISKGKIDIHFFI